MKHIVRAAVITLVLTGAVASTQVPAAAAQTKITIAKNSAMPVPTCPLDDANGCGIR